MKPGKSEAGKKGGNQMQGCVNHALLFSVFLMFLTSASPRVSQFLEMVSDSPGNMFSYASHSHIPNCLTYQALTLQVTNHLP